jgi:hypothetical protein
MAVIKENNNVLEKHNIEESKLLDIPKKKKGGKLKLTDAERAKRAERCRALARRTGDSHQKLEQAVESVTTKWNYADIKELSQITGLSVANVKGLLFDKKKLKDWKKQKKRKIDITGMIVMEKLIRTVNEGRLGAYQGGIMFNMLYERFAGSKQAKADNIINIGDNRQVKVYYPNFDKQNENIAETNVDISKVPLKDL